MTGAAPLDSAKSNRSPKGFLGISLPWRRRQASEVKAENRKQLLLYVSDVEWQAMLLLGGKDEAQFLSGDELAMKHRKGNRLEQVIGMAIKGLPSAKRKKVNDLTLVIDDPGIVLIDDPAKQNAGRSPSDIRQIGRKLVNADEIHFGSVPVIADKLGAVFSNAIYGFVSTNNLKNNLNKLGDLLPRVRRVAPVPAIMASDLVRKSGTDVGQCMVSVTGWTTTLTMVGQRGQVIVTRSLPVGILTLADAVAKANSLSLGNALRNLSARDRVSDVPRWAGLDNEEQRRLSVLARAMGPVLSQLADGIGETLTYFSMQRVGGEIKELKFHGPVERITGLLLWLEKQVGCKMTKCESSILEILRDLPEASVMNLLGGAAGDFIKIGKLEFVLSEDQGLQPRGKDSKAEPSDSKGDRVTPRQRSFGRQREDRDRNRRSGRRRRGGVRSGNTFFGLELGFLAAGGNRGDLRETPVQGVPVYSAGVIVLAAGLLGLAYTYLFEPEVKSYRTVASKYSAAVARHQLVNQMAVDARSKLGIKRIVVVRDEDKVLWTEKMLALARYMNKRMWITDVYLTSDKRTISGDDVKNQVLSIEGSVLPSTEGHILEVSNYIRRLLTDKDKIFMEDFRDITFEGANIDQGEVDKIIRFRIAATYDAAKRLERRNNKVKTGGGNETDMNQAISDKNKRDQQFLPPGTRQ